MNTLTRELAYESIYQEIYIYPGMEMLMHVWKAATLYMTAEDYKKEQQVIAKAVARSGRVTRIFTDAQNFGFTITPSLQLWSVERITPQLLQNGIKRHAIRPSKDMFSNLSINQLAEEAQKQGYQVRTVESPAEAREWLLEEEELSRAQSA